MLANLLDKKNEPAALQQRHLVNGIGTGPKIVNHLVNGAGGLKRPSSADPTNGDGNHPNKKPMLDCNGSLMTNGPNTELDNGPIVKSDVNLGQAAFQNNNQPLQQQPGIILQQQPVLTSTTPGGQKIITGTDGKQYIVKTGPGCGNGTVIGTLTATPCPSPGMMQQQQQQQPQQPQQQLNGNAGQQVLYTQNQPGGGKTIIILQPQAKVLTSTGQQVLVQNSTGGQQIMVQNAAGGQQQIMVQNSAGQQQTLMVHNAAGQQQTLMVQNPSGLQQVMVQNPGGQQQQQQQPQLVIIQNSGGVPQQAVIRAVTTQSMVQQQQPTTLSYTTRPQLVTNVMPRPVVPQQPQPQQQQVPMQGLVRVSAPPIVQQAPVQVPTPPPPTLVVSTPAPPPVPSVPIPKPDPAAPFLCEWHGCMKAFKFPKDVERHAIVTHCPPGSDDIPCLWLRCDGMKRKRFSLMTHIQDRHCHPQVTTTGCYTDFVYFELQQTGSVRIQFLYNSVVYLIVNLRSFYEQKTHLKMMFLLRRNCHP